MSKGTVERVIGWVVMPRGLAAAGQADYWEHNAQITSS